MLLKMAPSKFAPLKFAYFKFAFDRLHFDKSAPEKSTPDKTAFLKFLVEDGMFISLIKLFFNSSALIISGVSSLRVYIIFSHNDISCSFV